jgi:uncharacterized membrane protein YcaP (DUF421 family)
MEWLWTNWADVGILSSRAVLVCVAMLVLTRVTGLRAYAKMSSTDFFTTVAIGSGVATVILSANTSLVAALIAMALLFLFQWFTAKLERLGNIEKYINNQPILLMCGDRLLEENLRRASCTEADVYAKLREANVFDKQQIIAVVFETTGDISVLHCDREEDAHIDMDIFEGIEGAEILRDSPRERSGLATEVGGVPC